MFVVDSAGTKTDAVTIQGRSVTGFRGNKQGNSGGGRRGCIVAWFAVQLCLHPVCGEKLTFLLTRACPWLQ